MEPSCALRVAAAIVAAIAGFAASAGQDGEEGRWLLETWGTRDLERSGVGELGPQVFAVARSPEGLVYLANNYGVVELDGHRSRLIRIEPGRIALSLTFDDRGRLWVGGSGTFGRLEPGVDGEFRFVSWLDRLPPAERTLGDVWTAAMTSFGVVFRAPDRLVLVRPDGAASSYAPEGAFGASGGTVGGRFFQRDTVAGLLELRAEGLARVPGGAPFSTWRTWVFLPFDERRMLVGTREAGFLLLDPDAPPGTEPEPWPTEIDGRLAEAQLYTGAVLADGSFAIGTLRAGAFVLDRGGRLLRTLDRQHGLSDDTVLAATADAAGTLWLGLGRGLACIDDATLTRFDEATGLPGSVESVARLGATLHAATAQGVYRLRPGAEARFEPVPGLSFQSFDLLAVGGSLLAATLEGVFELGPGGLRRLTTTQANNLLALEGGRRVLVGGIAGLQALSLEADGWRGSEPALEPAGEVSGLVEARGELWIETDFAAELLHRARLRSWPAAGDRLEIEVLGPVESADGPREFVNVLKLGDRLLVSTAGAVLAADVSSELERAREVERALGAFGTDVTRVSTVAPGRHMVGVGRQVVWLREKSDGSFEVEPLAPGLPEAGRILCLLHETGGVAWVGTDEGLFRVALGSGSRGEDNATSRRTLVRRVRGPHAEVFWTADALGENPAVAPIELPATARALRFELAAPWAEAPERLRFRSRLTPLETEPSSWSPEPWRDFTNLPAGSFGLEVEASNAAGETFDPARLAFAIAPFWWETWWARAAAGLAALGLAGAFARFRSRRLRARTAELEALVAQRTAELREASFTDPLTGARNRRYFTAVIEPELARASREPRPTGGLLFVLVDLDHFKQVNDQYGHAAGDAALRDCAERLRSTMRSSDLLFRWGGEEFLLVARDSPRDRGDELALRILAAVANTPFSRPDGEPLGLTASIGWAPFPLSPGDETSTVSQVLELADRALYRAKAAGRACAVGIFPAPPPDTAPPAEPGTTEPGFGDLPFASSLRRRD